MGASKHGGMKAWGRRHGWGIKTWMGHQGTGRGLKHPAIGLGWLNGVCMQGSFVVGLFGSIE